MGNSAIKECSRCNGNGSIRYLGCPEEDRIGCPHGGPQTCSKCNGKGFRGHYESQYTRPQYTHQSAYPQYTHQYAYPQYTHQYAYPQYIQSASVQHVYYHRVPPYIGLL